MLPALRFSGHRQGTGQRKHGPRHRHHAAGVEQAQPVQGLHRATLGTTARQVCAGLSNGACDPLSPFKAGRSHRRRGGARGASTAGSAPGHGLSFEGRRQAASHGALKRSSYLTGGKLATLHRSGHQVAKLNRYAHGMGHRGGRNRVQGHPPGRLIVPATALVPVEHRGRNATPPPLRKGGANGHRSTIGEWLRIPSGSVTLYPRSPFRLQEGVQDGAQGAAADGGRAGSRVHPG